MLRRNLALQLGCVPGCMALRRTTGCLRQCEHGKQVLTRNLQSNRDSNSSRDKSLRFMLRLPSAAVGLHPRASTSPDLQLSNGQLQKNTRQAGSEHTTWQEQSDQTQWQAGTEAAVAVSEGEVDVLRPAMGAAKAALGSLTWRDLSELKRLHNPPAGRFTVRSIGCSSPAPCCNRLWPSQGMTL